MSTAQTHGAGELRNTELEEQQSPLALFSKQIEHNYIEGGQEHRFKPFNSITNSGTVSFLIPSFTAPEYVYLPRYEFFSNFFIFKKIFFFYFQ